MTRGRERAPSLKQKAVWGKERRTPRPAESCNPRKAVAWVIDRSPFARGLVFVLSTSLSKSLSHISLIVQPAPRITKAPTVNNPISFKSGAQPGLAARAVDHQQG